jgi:hypothetical protein
MKKITLIKKAAIFLLYAFINTNIQAQADLKIFSFNQQENKTIPGLSTEKNDAYNCSGKVLEDDKIGNLALISLFYQNGCYTDGNYNHSNYEVERGIVTSSDKKLSFDAYRIHAPSQKANKFLASQHCIAYAFPTKEKYTIYELNGKLISKIKEIEASEIESDEYFIIKDLKVSNLLVPITYFFVPGNAKPSIYNQISTNVESALVKETPIADIYKFRYKTENVMPDPIIDRQNIGRQSFLLSEYGDKIAMVWQDKEDKTIWLSRFAEDLKSQTSIQFPNSKGAVLVAATNDNSGNYYYAVVEQKTIASENDLLTLIKVDKKGKEMERCIPETDVSGINLYRFSNYMADMEYANGKIALFIARKMNKSSDGLNHQGGIALIFDASTLELSQNLGQTSGHSFDNYLTVNAENEFIGLDLGDNYPRGINLHKINGSGKHSKVVYTFKTEHGNKSQSPAGKNYPLYPEISNDSSSYYKWSNDNGTYSSLGAVIELDNGYAVVFTGEPDVSGKSINNARVGNNNTDPRNIGFVKVVKDFENKSGNDCVVSDDMVLSKGPNESGGFYTFGGTWSEQRNKGIVWLTSYKDKNQFTAINLKAVKLPNNNILLLWELNASDGKISSYVSTRAMIIDANGEIVHPEIELSEHVRLNRRDEAMVVGNKVILASGSKNEKKLELIVLDMK